MSELRHPQHDLPEGMRSATASDEAIRLSADVVVVGLGAGGCMAFHDLARAGVDVIAVELGGYFPPEAMRCREELMIPQLFMEGASRATVDQAITVMQGRGVGGSTLHNTNLCKRLPDEILEIWKEQGVEDLDESLRRDFETVEELLGVHRVPADRVNANNQALLRGARALNYRHGILAHNRQGCQQSGMCELGCPNNGKQNAAKVLVPPALKAGGRALIHARVDRLLTRGSRMCGVAGHAVDPRTGTELHPFEVRAQRVVLGASATNSASLVIRSGLKDPQGLAGRRLHIHPGAFVMGVFDERVDGWKGVPQSAECTQFLQFGQGARERVWLVSGFAHPGAAAGLMPGFGASHAAMMRSYPHVAAIIAMVHDHYSGQVRPRDGERVGIHYRPDRGELEQIALGLREAARILFAAGARQVILPTSPPRVLDSPASLDELSATELGPFNPSLVAVHPMSTLWMGQDPASSVTTSHGAYHHVRGLFVADGSLFPTSIGGPPQIPIYAFGRRVARAVRESLPAR
ncbi:hypothetical protein DL240_08445 [Lujinxingia litoralis]|uniref:GMC family oxidoreductase n=1 Tax=Lujinxingia litoralis TaxID=2211119 RepID=A0A328C5Q3_9DELT|nr:GMC family oxidoreductase [Lujinxingia litoralis]RAL22911.1 hypothetical protein DL240_08445 [Lujinxingia litoralis]